MEMADNVIMIDDLVGKGGEQRPNIAASIWNLADHNSSAMISRQRFT